MGTNSKKFTVLLTLKACYRVSIYIYILYIDIRHCGKFPLLCIMNSCLIVGLLLLVDIHN